MGRRRSSREAEEKATVSRSEELRRILRIDWVLYAIIGVVCILALVGLHPAIQIDHALVGTLITFATGIIGGLFAYLRYRAENGKDDDDEEETSDG